ncbi:MAG: [FeFe] hydrogenase H-cluster radical SAM maturase HydE [Bacteroidales bacterium]|nr:[FeFe] hydrogenase H-cluster radical SAM maturase HydE [Bacteroidales bacterium]
MINGLRNRLADSFSASELSALLALEGKEKEQLFEYAAEIKKREIGNKVYFRGLLEYANACSKDCYYCGIRKSNTGIQRYQMEKEEVLKAAQYAYENDFASLVIQSGERSDSRFVDQIEELLKDLKKIGNGTLGITLSCGEQTKETYQRWYAAGAHRYLLRIEASNEKLYHRIHPQNDKHNFNKRIQSIYHLKEVGFQTGTGVMIGLPFQTLDDLANDLLFFKAMDIDMVGMGPYIEHQETPLYQYSSQILPLKDRLDLSLKMVALLRIIMPKINIAATTAMQTIDPQGREKAIAIGANVIMPNLTPLKYRDDYLLYNNKIGLDETFETQKKDLEANIQRIDHSIGYGEWGDSKHYKEKKRN